MNSAWQVERWRLVALVGVILLIGLVTGFWVIAIIVPTVFYLAWHLYQMHRLSSWLNEGSNPEQSPEAGGLWGEIAQQVHRQQRSQKKRKKRYKEMLSRVYTVIAANPDATVVLNKNMEIEWVNEPAKLLLGIQKSRDSGYFIGNLIRDPNFFDYMQSQFIDTDLEIASPLDRSRTVNIRLTPFGKKQFLLSARDISEQVELRRVRKAFVANASHELRTPLTVVSGYLEIMQSAPEMPESLFKPLASARDQAARMEGIIADLLTLSRIESTGSANDTEGEVLDVTSIIRSVIEDLKLTISNESHSFHVDLQQNLNIRAIKIELQSVVLNLCRNALLHTPVGTDIYVSWKLGKNGNACLTVRDNGDGIPIQHLHRLTERFYRIDAGRSRSVGGTGLGLSIVRHIMERYSGGLDVTSVPGEWSEFSACFGKTRIID